MRTGFSEPSSIGNSASLPAMPTGRIERPGRLEVAGDSRQQPLHLARAAPGALGEDQQRFAEPKPLVRDLDHAAGRSATSRAFMTASSVETPLLCGTLIVPKHRLEKRRRRFE